MDMDTKDIEAMMAAGRVSEAIEALDKAITECPDDADLYYLRGKAHWRMQQRGRAISDFEEAVHLDPSSPAVHALQMARDIMDFFNPDLLNP